MSKGIGLSYVEKMRSYHAGNLDHNYYQYYQYKKSLPRYYREKLYSRDELMSVMYDFTPDYVQEVEEYLRLNPGSNYFQNLHCRTVNYVKYYKEKSTKTEIL